MSGKFWTEFSGWEGDVLGVTHLPEFILRICAPTDAFQILKSFICLGVFFCLVLFLLFLFLFFFCTLLVCSAVDRLGPSADNLQVTICGKWWAQSNHSEWNIMGGEEPGGQPVSCKNHSILRFPQKTWCPQDAAASVTTAALFDFLSLNLKQTTSLFF